MPANRLPKRCFHRATGRYYVTLGGREIYLGSDPRRAHREYDRLIAEWLAGGRTLQAGGDAADLTIVELVDRFRRWAERQYRHPDGTSTGHAEATIKPALRALRLMYGDTRAAEFSPLKLQALREQMVRSGLARTCVNLRVQVVKRMFKWAVAQELVPVAVHQSLATVAGLRAGRTEARETEPVGPVDDAALEATLPYLPPVVAAMVQVQRLTGMRPDEVCRLRPADLDRTGDVWTYTPRQHKTAHRGRARVVCVGPRAQQVLLPFLLRDAEAFCFSPAESVARLHAARHARRVTPLHYGNRPGTNRQNRPKRKAGPRYDVNGYRRAIQRAADRANVEAHRERPDVPAGERLVPRWSPNQLRHARATEVRRQHGLEAAQVTLGHAKADVTQVYAERDVALAAAVARATG